MFYLSVAMNLDFLLRHHIEMRDWGGGGAKTIRLRLLHNVECSLG